MLSDSKKLKFELQRWVNQIGVYNDGCQCTVCMGQIYANMRMAVEKWADKQHTNEEMCTDFKLSEICKCGIPLSKREDSVELLRGCKQCGKKIKEAIL